MLEGFEGVNIYPLFEDIGCPELSVVDFYIVLIRTKAEPDASYIAYGKFAERSEAEDLGKMVASAITPDLPTTPDYIYIASGEEVVRILEHYDLLDEWRTMQVHGPGGDGTMTNYPFRCPASTDGPLPEPMA